MSRRDGGEHAPRSGNRPRPLRAVPAGPCTDRRTFIGTVTALGVLHTVAGTTVAGDPPAGATVGEAAIVGYGEGGFGEGGFGGLAAAEPVAAAVTISGPDEAEVGTAVELEVEVENTGSPPEEPVRLQLVVDRDGGVGEGDVELEHHDGDTGSWVPSVLTPTDASLVGWYGEEEGFELATGYDGSVSLRLTASTDGSFRLATVVVGVGSLQEEYASAEHALGVAQGDAPPEGTPTPTPPDEGAPWEPDSIPAPGLVPTLATVVGVGYLLNWVASRRSATDED